MARTGIIQTRGIGDIVIALPIACWLAQAGDEVFWPVDARWTSFLADAAPYVRFVPVPPEAERADYLVGLPETLLRECGAERSIMLYSALNNMPGVSLENARYSEYLKFDEYKYAVAGVPFAEKWNLELVRDARRERSLFESLGVGREYVCVHRRGANFETAITIPAEWEASHDIVEIDERSSSPFDWLLTLERAAKLVLIDSCFANLVEQLNLGSEKYLILRTPGPATPVYKNGWTFL